MSDRPRNEFNDLPDAHRLPKIDFGAQILSGGPSVSKRFREGQIEQEPGPPPSTQPRSNRPKFPEDTSSKDWWPTDNPVPGAPRWPFSKEDAAGGWGVHWHERPRLYPPMPNPGPDKPPVPPEPPKPPGPVTDGPITKPDTIQPPRLSDDDARKSVNINADARSIYMTAGLTGLGMGAGVHAADVYTGAVEPEARKGAIAFWRNNLSPSQRLVPERSAALGTIEAALPELRTTANAASHTFDRHIRFRTELVDNLVRQTPSTPIPPTEKAWYDARVEIVRENRLFTSENIRLNAGTDIEVAARQKLFTQGEANQMVTQADEFWAANRGNNIAQTALAEGEATRNRAAQMLYQAERGSITTGSQAMIKGLGQGLLLGTVTVGADFAMDKLLGNNPELSNSAHWGLQGIGMPLLLLSKAPMPAKIAGSLALVAGSHLLDQVAGPPTGIFSPFSRPSLPEIGLATAGALVPVQDTRIRAGLALGGWALGKTWNYLDAKYELSGRTEPRLQFETLASVDMDLKKPSSDRFMFAQEQMKNFSNRNDAASSVLIKDWQASSNAMTSIEKERGNAALMMGYGESMLARGSRVDQNKWDKDGRRLGAGLDYDLGGQATSYLRAANGNLQDALKLARENKGRLISSGTIDDAYISQLDYLQTMSRASLEKVYGHHDIPAVYKEVRQNVREHMDEMKVFGENLAQYAKTVSDTEPRYKAKISRDLALIHIAFADTDPSAGGQKEHSENARCYMEQAFKLDPSAPDYAQLLQLMNSGNRR